MGLGVYTHPKESDFLLCGHINSDVPSHGETVGATGDSLGSSVSLDRGPVGHIARGFAALAAVQ